MSRLRLQFLGSPVVTLADRAVDFPTRKTLALLIYLVTELESHSRDKLIALFWPDSDLPHGQATLRRTLAYLRQALGITDRHGGPYLLIERDSLAFDAACEFELDLRTLQLAWEGLHKSRQDDLLDWTLLQAAAAGYRDDFLAGFSLPDCPDFDDWTSLQREGWHRRAGLIFDRLSQQQLERGQRAAALETAARWITVDSLNEMAHRRLIQLHLVAGHRAAARQAYETLRVLWQAELGIEPSPETQALAEQINNPTLVRPAPSPTPYPQASLTTLPFVGRTTEYARLVTLYYTARRGQPQVVILEGEPGVGKTRLAQEFLAWAAIQRADILQGRALETGGRLPYQPLIDALRLRVEQENAPVDLLDDIWLSELSRLLPELRQRYPDLPPPLVVDDAAARSRLFEAVTRLVQALARRAPAVLFLDDLHWGDTASLDLLLYAASHWAADSIPFLLLVNLRSENLAAQPALARWLANLSRELPLTRLALASLTVEDTRQLLEALSGTATSQTALHQFSQWLHQESGGQPFFLLETLRGLIAEGRLQPDESGRWLIGFDTARWDRDFTIPASILELLQGRLARLQSDALAACKAGAVLGDSFNFEQICRVAALSEDIALAALDDLVAYGLLHETGERYHFNHDKIREVAYASISPARRHIFHRRALEVLEATIHSPAVRVRHALAAGLMEPAFGLSLAAGDEAMAVFAVREAIAHYEQARMLISTLQLPVTQLQSLYLQLGRAYELTDQWAQARVSYQALLRVAWERRSATLECTALNRLATLAAQDALDLETAQALLQQAIRLAEASNDLAALAETEWNLAQIALYAWESNNALRHGERALDLARQLNSPELMARCLNAVAFAHLRLGHWQAVQIHAGEARSLYATLSNQAMEVDCLCQMAEAQFRLGQPYRGAESARLARTISRKIENIWGQVNSAIVLVPTLVEVGDYGQALIVARESVDLARTLSFPPLLIYSLLHLSAVYRAVQALEAARQTCQEALALCQHFAQPHFKALVMAELSAIRALAKEWAQVAGYVRQMVETDDYVAAYGGLSYWLVVEALLHSGQAELAVEATEHFSEHVAGNSRYRIPYLRCRAVLARWVGDNSLAIIYLQEALSLAQEIGLPGEQWPILVALGQLYQAASDSAKKQQALTQAAVIVQTLAAKIEDKVVRTEFLKAASVAVEWGKPTS